LSEVQVLGLLLERPGQLVTREEPTGGPVAFRQWPRVIERRLCFFSSASSDGRRNTPL